MEYQKIINLLANTPNQPAKFRTKIWVEINDESRLKYKIKDIIKLDFLDRLDKFNVKFTFMWL